MNTKYISSNVMKVSANSRVRGTREFTDTFITFDEIYLVFISKKWLKALLGIIFGVIENVL